MRFQHNFGHRKNKLAAKSTTKLCRYRSAHFTYRSCGTDMSNTSLRDPITQQFRRSNLWRGNCVKSKHVVESCLRFSPQLDLGAAWSQFNWFCERKNCLLCQHEKPANRLTTCKNKRRRQLLFNQTPHAALFSSLRYRWASTLPNGASGRFVCVKCDYSLTNVAGLNSQ